MVAALHNTNQAELNISTTSGKQIPWRAGTLSFVYRVKHKFGAFQKKKRKKKHPLSASVLASFIPQITFRALIGGNRQVRRDADGISPNSLPFVRLVLRRHLFRVTDSFNKSFFSPPFSP